MLNGKATRSANISVYSAYRVGSVNSSYSVFYSVYSVILINSANTVFYSVYSVCIVRYSVLLNSLYSVYSDLFKFLYSVISSLVLLGELMCNFIEFLHMCDTICVVISS